MKYIKISKGNNLYGTFFFIGKNIYKKPLTSCLCRCYRAADFTHLYTINIASISAMEGLL